MHTKCQRSRLGVSFTYQTWVLTKSTDWLCFNVATEIQATSRLWGRHQSRLAQGRAISRE